MENIEALLFLTSAGLIVTVTDLGEERENTRACMSTSGLIFVQTNWVFTCYIYFILKAGGFFSILLCEVKIEKYYMNCLPFLLKPFFTMWVSKGP